MRFKAGDVIGGKYRIVRLIGDGGMGAVYEARHEILGSAVALKFLHAELAGRPGLASRFLQEARVSASIERPPSKRVLIKLRGEALMGKQQYGIDEDVLTAYANEIKTVVDAFPRTVFGADFNAQAPDVPNNTSAWGWPQGWPHFWAGAIAPGRRPSCGRCPRASPP